jgi:hypothetical protein
MIWGTKSSFALSLNGARSRFKQSNLKANFRDKLKVNVQVKERNPNKLANTRFVLNILQGDLGAKRKAFFPTA